MRINQRAFSFCGEFSLCSNYCSKKYNFFKLKILKTEDLYIF